MQKLLFVIILFVIVSCEESFDEENLEDTHVTLLAPAENTSLTAGDVSFFWEELEGASSYQLQIAQPDFNNPAQFVYNEVVEDSLSPSLTLLLDSPGTYQWRVRAQNSIYNSPYTTNNLIISSNEENLEDAQVTLLAPAENTSLTAGDISFFWEELEGATSYRLQIAQPDFNNPAQFLYDETIEGDSGMLVTFSLNSPGTYQWRVRAQNDTYNSPYTIYNLIIN